MATMNISLPDELKSFVDQQVSEHDYGSSREYLRELNRKQRDVAELSALLLEGANSGPGDIADEEFFAELRQIAKGEVRA